MLSTVSRRLRSPRMLLAAAILLTALSEWQTAVSALLVAIAFVVYFLQNYLRGFLPV